MSDTNIAPAPASNPVPKKEPIFNPPSMWKRLWDDMDILKLLALVLVISYIAAVMTGIEPDETHKNLTMMAAAFYFGSSLGSKNKDKPPAA